MTRKTIKTLLFASLITTMLISISTNQAYAKEQIQQEHTQEEQIQQEFMTLVLSEAAPYITRNDDDTISFDSKQALNDGVSEKIVEEGIHLTKEQNRLVRGEITSIPEYDAYFSYRNIQQKLSLSQVDGCNWGGQKSTPDRQYYQTYQSTLDAGKAWMILIGYHNIAEYALHYSATEEIAARNFQKSVTAHGCELGVFRAEVLLFTDGKTYRYSSPEPNPEYKDKSYEWPVVYWPAFILWWHAIT